MTTYGRPSGVTNAGLSQILPAIRLEVEGQIAQGDTDHAHLSRITIVSRDAPRQAHARVAVRDRVPRLRRRVDHERRASVHPARAPLLGRGAAMDPERLP